MFKINAEIEVGNKWKQLEKRWSGLELQQREIEKPSKTIVFIRYSKESFFFETPKSSSGDPHSPLFCQIFGHFGGPFGSQNQDKNCSKMEVDFGNAFLLICYDFGSLFGGISESILTNFRVVVRSGRGALRLRRRSRIEGRSSPKQAKNEREGRKNSGFDARPYF